MTQEALKLALEALEGVLDDAPKVLDASISGGLYEVVQCREAITAIKEALREHAMREVQRLGQEIEQEPVVWMQVTKYGNKLLAFTEPPLEPPCYTGEFIAAKNYPLFLKKENT